MAKSQILIRGAQSFKVAMDCDLMLVQLAGVSGIERVHEGILKKRFPAIGGGRKEMYITVFHFGKLLLTPAAAREMKAKGCRPADINELAALGNSPLAYWPDFKIAGLGSSWRDSDGSRVMPCLFAHKKKIHLEPMYGFGWTEGWQFAGVQE